MLVPAFLENKDYNGILTCLIPQGTMQQITFVTKFNLLYHKKAFSDKAC